jgi:hypothetical protein
MIVPSGREDAKAFLTPDRLSPRFVGLIAAIIRKSGKKPPP